MTDLSKCYPINLKKFQFTLKFVIFLYRLIRIARESEGEIVVVFVSVFFGCMLICKFGGEDWKLRWNILRVFEGPGASIYEQNYPKLFHSS
jgi:hypothetical protein